MNTIMPDELRKRLGANEALTLLDVREKEELTSNLGHIEGIVHIPLGELPVRLGDLEDAKNAPVIAICKMGGRASHAAEFLQQAGFTNVLVLVGGMIAWNDCGLPVETSRR